MVLVPRKANSFNTILSSVIFIENHYAVPGELTRTQLRDSAIRV